MLLCREEWPGWVTRDDWTQQPRSSWRREQTVSSVCQHSLRVLRRLRTQHSDSWCQRPARSRHQIILCWDLGVLVHKANQGVTTPQGSRVACLQVVLMLFISKCLNSSANIWWVMTILSSWKKLWWVIILGCCLFVWHAWSIGVSANASVLVIGIFLQDFERVRNDTTVRLLDYITYRFIMHPTCQFASEYGLLERCDAARTITRSRI